MIQYLHNSYAGHEVNLVFARGLPPDALTRGIRDLRREPLDHGEADGWTWAVHDMANWEEEDYDDIDYGRLCPEGAELVVFVTEPCSAKAHAPTFSYYRDGRVTLYFSFEDVGQRVGDNPDYLSPELLAAAVIGPDAECAWREEGHDCSAHHDDDERRLVQAIAGYFNLPSPPLTSEVTGR